MFLLCLQIWRDINKSRSEHFRYFEKRHELLDTPRKWINWRSPPFGKHLNRSLSSKFCQCIKMWSPQAGGVWILCRKCLVGYVIILFYTWKPLSVDAPPASCPPCQYFCPKGLLILCLYVKLCGCESVHRQTDRWDRKHYLDNRRGTYNK